VTVSEFFGAIAPVGLALMLILGVMIGILIKTEDEDVEKYDSK
jgi:hypothetical protein